MDLRFGLVWGFGLGSDTDTIALFCAKFSTKWFRHPVMYLNKVSRSLLPGFLSG